MIGKLSDEFKSVRPPEVSLFLLIFEFCSFIEFQIAIRFSVRLCVWLAGRSVCRFVCLNHVRSVHVEDSLTQSSNRFCSSAAAVNQFVHSWRPLLTSSVLISCLLLLSSASSSSSSTRLDLVFQPANHTRCSWPAPFCLKQNCFFAYTAFLLFSHGFAFVFWLHLIDNLDSVRTWIIAVFMWIGNS